MGCSGHIFLDGQFPTVPSPLQVYIGFHLFWLVWFGLVFFLFFLGDAGGTAAAGVFGVAVEDLGDVAGGSGTATDDDGALICF